MSGERFGAEDRRQSEAIQNRNFMPNYIWRVGSALKGRIQREGDGVSIARTLSETRHFVAPVLAWHASARSTLKVSTAFGVTAASDRCLVRVEYVYELPIRGAR